MEIEIKVETGDRPSLKAFKEYMCNKYRVQSVNDIPISINEYADMMDLFERGWAAREQAFIDRVMAGGKK